jgi:hypothetical protein
MRHVGVVREDERMGPVTSWASVLPVISVAVPLLVALLATVVTYYVGRGPRPPGSEITRIQRASDEIRAVTSRLAEEDELSGRNVEELRRIAHDLPDFNFSRSVTRKSKAWRPRARDEDQVAV